MFAVRIKVVFDLSLQTTSFEVRSSKAEEPKEQMWAPSPCQKQKTQTALNPASRKQPPVQWLRGRQQEKHLQPLWALVCVLCYNWQQNGDVIWFSSFGKKIEREFCQANVSIKDLLNIYKPVPLKAASVRTVKMH